MSLPALLPSTRLALQVAVAAVLSSAFVDLTRIDRPYWVLLAAVAVMVGSAGETLAKSINRTVSTLLGLVAGAALYWAAERTGLPPLAPLMAATVASFFFLLVNYRPFIVALTIALAILFELSGAGEATLLARLYDTAIGASIGALVSFLVLPVPTQRPVIAAVNAYVAALGAMVHEAIDAMIRGRWTERVEAGADRVRSLEGKFDAQADALRVESAILGGRGRAARLALAVLPVLRGHVEAIVEASGPATRTGLGAGIAEELGDIDRQLAANLETVRMALVEGRDAAVPSLEPIFARIEAKLAPRLMESPQARTEIVTMMNALLALRRLNRGLMHVAENRD